MEKILKLFTGEKPFKNSQRRVVNHKNEQPSAFALSRQYRRLIIVNSTINNEGRITATNYILRSSSEINQENFVENDHMSAEKLRIFRKKCIFLKMCLTKK